MGMGDSRNEGTSTLTGSLMSAAMLAARKGPVAELALVLLLRQRRLPHLRRCSRGQDVHGRDGHIFGCVGGIRVSMLACLLVCLSSPVRYFFLTKAIVWGTVWRASVGVGFKVRLDFGVLSCSFAADILSSMGVYCGWQKPVSRRTVLAWARTAWAVALDRRQESD